MYTAKHAGTRDDRTLSPWRRILRKMQGRTLGAHGVVYARG